MRLKELYRVANLDQLVTITFGSGESMWMIAECKKLIDIPYFDIKPVESGEIESICATTNESGTPILAVRVTPRKVETERLYKSESIAALNKFC